MTTEHVCAWCAKESGEAPATPDLVSHGVCARHWCMELLRAGLPAQQIKDRAVRLFGTPEALASFNAAVQLISLECVPHGRLAHA